MLTWQDLLDHLRLDMKDNESNPKIDEDAAYMYLRWALRDYSQFNPRIQTATLDIDDNGSAQLPGDLINIKTVRNNSDGKIIPPLWGASAPPQGAIGKDRWRWWIEGSSIRVNTWGDSPDKIDILYNAYHPAPSASDDYTFQMTFPDEDEEAILLYIRAKDMGSLRSKTARADRYKRRTTSGNTRTDNPIRPEEDELMWEYLALMNRRYSRGAVRLRRVRR